MTLKTLLFFSFFTLTSLFADTSSTDAEFRGEAKTKITFLEKQNDELKVKLESLEDKQKSVEEYKAIIDRQDKRVEDVNAKMAWAAEKTSWLAIIVGILTLFAGFVGFMTYRQNEKAKEEAKRDMKNWQDQIKKEFDQEFEKFKKHADSKTEEMTQDAEKIHKLKKEIEKSQDISKLNNSSSEEQKLASQESQKLATQAEKTNSWKDYIKAIKLSFFAENYGDALRNSDNALFELRKQTKVKNSNQTMIELIKVQIANVLFLKGLILGKIDKTKEEIQVYDEMFREFKDTDNGAIQENIAKALVNKGITLRQMNKFEEAIAVFDELLHKFKDTYNEAIQEQIATALFSKGFALGQINKSEEAIKVFDELIRGFKDTDNEAIQERIANAYLNLLELFLMHGREWSNEDIQWIKEYGKEHKTVMLQFKMLEIVKNALNEDRTLVLAQLKTEYNDTNFGGWSWHELNTWAFTLQGEQKERVLKTIAFFENWDKQPKDI